MKYVTLAHIIVVTSFCSIVSAQELSKRDQIHVSVQSICPASGQKLGEHGTPVKVKVGEETVFFCCQSCLQGKVNPQHWATVHANFAKAQRICPVMKKELPKNPKWTIVEGQIVYVCCPPCTKKIAADPQTYLTKVDELYTASLKAKQPRR
jgi:YHS domain-containing protein